MSTMKIRGYLQQNILFSVFRDFFENLPIWLIWALSDSVTCISNFSLKNAENQWTQKTFFLQLQLDYL